MRRRYPIIHVAHRLLWRNDMTAWLVEANLLAGLPVAKVLPGAAWRPRWWIVMPHSF